MIRRQEGYVLFFFLFMMAILLPIIAGMVGLIVDHREILAMRLHQMEARKMAFNVMEQMKRMEDCKTAVRQYDGRKLYDQGGEVSISIRPCDGEKEWEAIIRVQMESGEYQMYRAVLTRGKILNVDRYYNQ